MRSYRRKSQDYIVNCNAQIQNWNEALRRMPECEPIFRAC